MREGAERSGLSGITWSGFDNFYYLFTYEDTKAAFSIPYDLQILEAVYKVPAISESEDEYKARELYNRNNSFFKSKAIEALEGSTVQRQEQIRRIKKAYEHLSDVYQKSKGGAGIPLA